MPSSTDLHADQVDEATLSDRSEKIELKPLKNDKPVPFGIKITVD